MEMQIPLDQISNFIPTLIEKNKDEDIFASPQAYLSNFFKGYSPAEFEEDMKTLKNAHISYNPQSRMIHFDKDQILEMGPKFKAILFKAEEEFQDEAEEIEDEFWLDQLQWECLQYAEDLWLEMLIFSYIS